MNNIIEAVTKELEKLHFRSAWKKGVLAYAGDLWDGLKEQVENGYLEQSDLESPKLVHKALLNGADSWHEYSWGGLLPDL